jgi:hypothetical protein
MGMSGMTISDAKSLKKLTSPRTMTVPQFLSSSGTISGGGRLSGFIHTGILA